MTVQDDAVDHMASPAGLPAAAATLRTWLDEADRVLVAAGAGLSVAAGYDYGDAARFRELLPVLCGLGLRYWSGSASTG